jgi:hypothetical protein
MGGVDEVAGDVRSFGMGQQDVRDGSAAKLGP